MNARRTGARSTYVIGVDTGGTFTDCVILDQDGASHVGKALSTPHELESGVMSAIECAAEALGRSCGDVLRDTSMFCHATTAGLNELYTRAGARLALVTTRGHEDATRIGRVFLKAAGMGDLAVTDVARLAKPSPLVEVENVIGVSERIDSAGDVVVELTEQEIERTLTRIETARVEAIAISLLWSFVNPEHERRLAEAIRGRFPDAFLSVSSEIAPVLGEYERGMTTVINSYIGPTLSVYLEQLAQRLLQRGLPARPLMMQSNGGVLPLEQATQRAVNMLHSGPAGGVIASAVLGAEIGSASIITTDVGGTSFDVSLVTDGEPVLSAEPELDRFSVVAPMIDVRSIGAGGGSIAAVDDEGALRVGPRSAGSDPGPVCYGKGGTKPTVTDANLVLGRLEPDLFFGGRLRLNLEAARRTIEKDIADPLEMSVVEAAHGIVEIVDNMMADLVRRVTTERGHDARDFLLFAFGGGGPVHVGAYGATIGASRAVIPAEASVFSALGVAAADARHRAGASAPSPMPFDPQAANALFQRLAEQGRTALADSGTGLNQDYLVTMRFRNQAHDVAVPIDRLPLTDEAVDELGKTFLRRYEQHYGVGTALPGVPVEAVTYEVVTTARRSTVWLSANTNRRRPSNGPNLGSREVGFGREFVETSVFDGLGLRAGDQIEGPALLQCPTTTAVIHPGQRVEVDDFGNFILQFEGVSAA